MQVPKPVVLIILDGWGLAPAGPGNAATQAKIPNLDRFWAVYPKTELVASGEAVGLPRSEEGNSETGHLNLGAGQIVFQELPRIDMAIANGTFFRTPAFKTAAEHVRKNNSNLHLLGLLGAGGVHSSLEHIFALLQFAKKENLKSVFLHLFTDGRDSPPRSSLTYIEKVRSEIQKIGIGQIATLCGRYYAMDRDHRWERTQKAYEALVLGKGKMVKNVEEGIHQSYEVGKTDEFVEPIILNKEGLINDRDAAIFFNFRIDRPRQLTKAFILPNFEQLVIKKVAFDPYAERYGLRQYEVPKETTTFKREKVLKDLLFVTMVEYETGLPVQVGFIPETVDFPLGRVLAEKGLRQFHIAETEKERHVTYYFNGRREGPFPGEDQVEIPSPKVASYDEKPEMAAHQVTETLLKRLKLGIYDFAIVNYANPDMVGHTGSLKAGIKACEATDEYMGKIVKAVVSLGGVAIVTADHGNVEEMINLKTGEIDTKHSTNPVPLVIAAKTLDGTQKALPRGILADIAPTILGIMKIPKPHTMTGRDLLEL